MPTSLRGRIVTRPTAVPPAHDPDRHKGAVEGDRQDEPQFYNPNLDENGEPVDGTAICEDSIGANVDESQG